ncbi:Pimeloyl-ACP methyl ester carboxylesterase [Sinosporangium album]|uniref:Pimeloyl-ACP methyl ester carboxylesterase n=1 Tax=Sinosporangium album TaxID=504805 RepID=A0A1G7WH52_9ACTN|nr:alpha/beta hydrolase [Sinosporangium album]SDG71228.1 Pimeloyl-ACP methyl ester carboxylesterase [Sinosporangium album]
MPFVSLRDAEIHYEVEGSGPGLVLVHGTGGNAESVYGASLPHFNGDRTVIRPNFSGSGQTTDGGGTLTVEQVADQIAAVTRKESDGPADLVGFSLGAVAVAAVAARYPELVRRLVLVAGWAHSTGPRDHLYFHTWRGLFDADRELFKRFTTLTGFSAHAVDGFGHEGLAASFAAEWPPASMARQIDLCAAVDIRDLLPKIQAPTLVLALGEDTMVPPDGSRQLQAGIPGSRLVQLDGVGHLDWLGRPDQVVGVVKEFLAD